MEPVDAARLAQHQGRPQQANQILIEALKAAPQRPELWDALAEAVSDPARQQECRERAHALRATHPATSSAPAEPRPAALDTPFVAQPATPSPVPTLSAPPTEAIAPHLPPAARPDKTKIGKPKGRSPAWMWVTGGLSVALACLLFSAAGFLALWQFIRTSKPPVAQATARPAATADCRASARHYYDRIAPTLGLILTLDEANARLLRSPTIDDLATVIESVPGRGQLVEKLAAMDAPDCVAAIHSEIALALRENQWALEGYLSGEVSAAVLATQARSSEARLSAAADSLASVMGVHSLAAYTGSGDAPPATARPTRTVAPTQDLTGASATETIAPSPAVAEVNGSIDDCSEKPADVPLMVVETDYTYCDKSSVMFATSAISFSEALQYYRTELASFGWIEETGTTYVSDEGAVISYTKGGHRLFLTIGIPSSNAAINVTLMVDP